MRLEEAIAAHLHPVDPTKAPAIRPGGIRPGSVDRDARQTVKNELLYHLLRALQPPEFEHVIRLLLGALDYQDVNVVGKTGDHGVDVRAVLRYRGVADVPTSVQAKRYGAGNNVEGSVIGRLRGSLPVEAHGIVITTSDFTKQARVEATMPGLKPIALVNGTDLIELLVDLGIGVEKRQVEVIRLAAAKLAADLAG